MTVSMARHNRTRVSGLMIRVIRVMLASLYITSEGLASLAGQPPVQVPRIGLTLSVSSDSTFDTRDRDYETAEQQLPRPGRFEVLLPQAFQAVSICDTVSFETRQRVWERACFTNIHACCDVDLGDDGRQSLYISWLLMG